MFNIKDTIVAIASGLQPSAIAIIRISGNETKLIIDKIFQFSNKLPNTKSIKPKVINVGFITDIYTNKILDEVVLVYMQKGNSFTGEELAEIQCHGNPLICTSIINLVLKLPFSVRIAECGEFTKRAYLNKKIDLIQAEAINEIITSRNEILISSGLTKIQKGFSKFLVNTKNTIMDIVSHIEVIIDYPEEKLDDIIVSKYTNILLEIGSEVNRIITNSENGKFLSNGISLCITGKTNVGKSSLFNILNREDRSIVSEIHGTTRDYIDSEISLDGLNINLIDTAGIRNSIDPIEKQGNIIAYKKIEESDYIIYLLDISKEWDEFNNVIFSKIKNKNYLIIINKTDLMDHKLELPDYINKNDILYISLKNIINIKGKINLEKDIKSRILNKLNFTKNNYTYTCNIRQVNILKEVLEIIKRTEDNIRLNMFYDIISVDFREILNKISEITGEITHDDILDNIFSKFCVGK